MCHSMEQFVNVSPFTVQRETPPCIFPLRDENIHDDLGKGGDEGSIARKGKEGIGIAKGTRGDKGEEKWRKNGTGNKGVATGCRFYFFTKKSP